MSIEGKECHVCGKARIVNGRCPYCGWAVTKPPVPSASRVKQPERDYWSKVFGTDTERKDK